MYFVSNRQALAPVLQRRARRNSRAFASSLWRRVRWLRRKAIPFAQSGFSAVRGLDRALGEVLPTERLGSQPRPGECAKHIPATITSLKNPRFRLKSAWLLAFPGSKAEARGHCFRISRPIFNLKLRGDLRNTLLVRLPPYFAAAFSEICVMTRPPLVVFPNWFALLGGLIGPFRESDSFRSGVRESLRVALRREVGQDRGCRAGESHFNAIFTGCALTTRS
jgi:hypothetical protein